MHDVSFQDIAEVLNLCMIDWRRYTNHTLCHPKIFQRVNKHWHLIMKTLSTMNNGTTMFKGLKSINYLI